MGYDILTAVPMKETYLKSLNFLFKSLKNVNVVA